MVHGDDSSGNSIRRTIGSEAWPSSRPVLRRVEGMGDNFNERNCLGLAAQGVTEAFATDLDTCRRVPGDVTVQPVRERGRA